MNSSTKSQDVTGTIAREADDGFQLDFLRDCPVRHRGNLLLHRAGRPGQAGSGQHPHARAVPSRDSLFLGVKPPVDQTGPTRSTDSDPVKKIPPTFRREMTRRMLRLSLRLSCPSRRADGRRWVFGPSRSGSSHMRPSYLRHLLGLRERKREHAPLAQALALHPDASPVQIHKFPSEGQS